MSSHLFRLVALTLGALAVIAIALSPTGDARADLGDARADAELQKIQARLKDASPAERGRVRQDLLAFRVAHAGTPAAVRAAGILAHLPSPLDALSPAAIPALERFAWQPKELVGVIGEHRGRHGNTATAVAWAPDGNFLVSGGGNYVRVWDASTMRQVGLAGFGHLVTGIAWSKDAKTIAVTGHAGLVTVYDVVKDGPPVARDSVAAGTSTVYGVSFHPDSKVIAVGCHDNSVRLIDVTGKKLKETANIVKHSKACTAVAFSPDGKTLATGSGDETVRLWDYAAGEIKERAILEPGSKDVTALAFSPSSGTLAAAASDGEVRMWGMGSTAKAPKVVLPIKAGSIPALSFSHTGNTLAAACSDGTIRVWTVTGGVPRERYKIEGHADPVTCVAYSPDSRRLASTSADWTVRTWDMTGTRPKERFVPWSHLSHVYSMAFAPDSQSIVSGSLDRIVRVWDLTKSDLRTRNFLKGEPVAIYAVAFSADGKLVAAGGNSVKIHQWDAHTGRQKATMTAPGAVYRLQYTPDGRRLAALTLNEAVLWDAVKSAELRRFGGVTARLNCMDVSPDGKYMLTGHGFYLYKDGKIALNKAGGYIYTDCFLKLHDMEEGKELAVDKSHEVPIYGAAFSADGKTAFSGAYEAQVRRWDVSGATLASLPPWKGSSGYASQFLINPDGATAFTAGLDGSSTVIHWDLATGKRLKQWAFQENVGGLALASDGRHLAVGLGTGVVYLLRLGLPSAPGSGS